MNVVILLAAAAAGYLSGSISYATIVTRRVRGKDIREMGSKNPGSLNVGANLGKRWGLLVGFLDVLKSFFPMLVTELLLSGKNELFVYLAVMTAGIGAIIGHWKPVFHRFKGGQCVGTSAGVFLFILPLEFLISFLVGSVLVFLFLRRLVDKWARWVPLTFIMLVPLIAVLLNVLVDVPFFARVSLGGHPWYWMAGIGVVCLLLLAINLRYIRARIAELSTRARP